MILPGTRVLVVDDNPDHLRGLAEGLHAYGAACLEWQFTGAAAPCKCPQVRVIFTDLHLIDAAAGQDQSKNFSVVSGLIEGDVTPAGPYVVVLWTHYADEAADLHTYLVERLPEGMRPLAVLPLDKIKHLDQNGKVRDISALVANIDELMTSQPQLTALLNWEEHVLGAAGDVVSTITSLARRPPGQVHGPSLGDVLYNLAEAAVGEEHVSSGRFNAVNEALLPILADRVAFLRGTATDETIWQRAFPPPKPRPALSADDAAALNSAVLIAPPGYSTDRGAVLDLTADFMVQRTDFAADAPSFDATFAMTAEEAAVEQFACRTYDVRCKWVLVQSQAACDFAQKQPGPVPFLLGLQQPEDSLSKGTPAGAIWRSPTFMHEGLRTVLVVNARYSIGLAAERLAGANVLYRLREQLLNELAYRTHTYSARPGFISFRESKQKPQKT